MLNPLKIHLRIQARWTWQGLQSRIWRIHCVFIFHSQIQTNVHLLITKYDSNLHMMLTSNEVILAFIQGWRFILGVPGCVMQNCSAWEAAVTLLGLFAPANTPCNLAELVGSERLADGVLTFQGWIFLDGTAGCSVNEISIFVMFCHGKQKVLELCNNTCAKYLHSLGCLH